MHVLLVLGVVSLFLSSSEGLEAKKGHHRHRLKELGKQKNLRGSLKEEKLLANGKYKVIGRNLKANQTTREATERSFALLSRTYSLKIKKKEASIHHKRTNRNFPSKISPQIFQKSPFIKQEVRNSRAPKASFVKVPSSAPRDSFEIVSEGKGSTQSKTKDDVLLETLMQTDTDSDSNPPITDDSEQDENEDISVPRSNRNSVHRTDNKERPDDTDEEKLPHTDDLETKEQSRYDHNNNADDGDDDDEPDDDKEDANEDEDDAKEKKPVKIENQESQLKKIKHDENQNISPYEISDQMSQDLTRIHGGIEDPTAALAYQERHLQAMNELRAYSARIRQKMLQRLRFSYGNIVNQNTLLVPQYYISQPLTVPEVAVKVPSLVRPSTSVFRAAFLKPMQRTYSLPQSNNQGYSINVNGLHGVFSKTPGYVVRFHSPDSEVTVVKKQHVTDPTRVRALKNVY